MNASEIVKFSSWLVENHKLPVQEDEMSTVLTEQFWPLTKVRNERWNSELNSIEAGLKFAGTFNQNWLKFRQIAHEVIVSESLSRIWFAVAIMKTGDEDVADMAECVISDHVRTRKRIFAMLESPPSFAREVAQKIEMLRALCDQATDMMLSQLPDTDVARCIAISTRTFDCFVECGKEYDRKVLQQANSVLCNSYLEDISRISSREFSNEDLYKKIIESVLIVFESEEPSSANTVNLDVAGV